MYRHLLQTIRLTVACAVSYGGSLLLGFNEGYWAVITAVVVTQPMFGDTLSASKDRIVGTLIGALAGLAVLWAGQWRLPQLWLFWVALVPLALLTAIRPNRRIACITLAIVVLVPATGPPFVKPVDRVLEILLGTAASIAISLLIPLPAISAVTVASADVEANALGER